MTIPTVFYGYPDQPSDIAESIETAIATINQGSVVSVKGWKENKTSGKIIIGEILTEIDAAELFACDLTHLNLNVLFELGYAIGTNKRIWISISDTVDADRRGVRRLEPLIPVGYSAYTNSQQLSSAFYQEQPWEDLEGTLGKVPYEFVPASQRGSSLLYLKSPKSTDASIQLSQSLDSSKIFRERMIDDPTEVPHESLEWYIQKVRRSDAVVVHLLSTDNRSSESHNAKCSLVAGIARGLKKPLLMLAHAPFSVPMDFQNILKIHQRATECKNFINVWLDNNEGDIVRRREGTAAYSNSRKLSHELAQLTVGEIVAENESESIDDYFLETGAYRQALSGSQTIFVGRKGSGKTANFFATALELGKYPKNHVCIIKPLSYELEGIVSLTESLVSKSERGYLIESLWKFIIYTELSKTLVSEIRARPAYRQTTKGEQDLIDFFDMNQNLLNLPFSLRLEKAIQDLTGIDEYSTSENQRIHVSESLHDKLLSKLRSLISSATDGRERIAVLIDNLDKSWGEQQDVAILSQMISGLLGVSSRVSEELYSNSKSKDVARFTLSIFLRSDIFAVIKDLEREPDKISHERITWEDLELLMRVIDSRLSYSMGGESPDNIWKGFFVQEIDGIPIRVYIGRAVIPRPRDVIYFVRQAISEAVNRGHSTITSEDIISASVVYSQYAFDALLVEDDPRLGKLETLLYEFAGSPSTLDQSGLDDYLDRADIFEDHRLLYMNLLFDTNFLGIYNANGTFEFPVDESRRHTAQRVARQIAIRAGSKESFQINPVFWPVLQVVQCMP